MFLTVLYLFLFAGVATATEGDWRYPAGVLVAIFAFCVATDVWMAIGRLFAGP